MHLLRENMTSSTKSEVHNVLHCRQRRIQPRPQVTRTESFVKFGRVVFEICERTDTHRQTDRLIAILCNCTGCEVISALHDTESFPHNISRTDTARQMFGDESRNGSPFILW